ncbi:T9SS type A sorting domain-containing protein, partial [bacterium]|nr:T9SS type A sorting domain-containing protein [bacterium]
YDLFIGCDEQPDSFVGPTDIHYYENIGNPTVPLWQYITGNYISFDIGDKVKPHSIDIDADSDLDILMARTGDMMSHYANIGLPSAPFFQKVTDTYQDIEVDACHPFFSDIDADLDLDLFIGEGVLPNPPYPGLYLYRNVGTPQNATYNLITNNLVPGTYHVSIAPSLADIDDDGDEDLFLSDMDGIFYYFENIGSPSVPSFSDPVLNWQGINTPGGKTPSRFYDIDDDGDLDLFIIPLTTVDQIWFYRNVGTAQEPVMQLETETFLPIIGENSFLGFDVMDIDADGDGDFFLGVAQYGGMFFFRNISDTVSAPRLTLDPFHGIQFSIGPNPANPITWISYNLPYPQKAEIAVYNLLGQKVATLASGLQMPGEQILIWDAANYSSGQYFIKLETPSNSALQTVTVVK